jgi:predicted RecA/RadA family phage recombinase
VDNYLQTGNHMPYTNAGSAIAAGAVVVSGHTIGVAVNDIAATTGTGVLAIRGVFTVPKVAAAVFVAGEKLIYDVSAAAFDDSAATPGAGDITGGAVAFAAGAADETTCQVLLTPGNATKT